MNITEKQYKKWTTLAKVVATDEYIAEEILSTLLEKILTNNNQVELNDNYIFISLKRAHLNYLRDEKIRQKRIEKYLFDTKEDVDTLSLLDIEELDKEKQALLEKTVKGFKQLNTIEKQLYYLHYIVGYTQTFIAERINVPYKAVNQRISRIKTKIKNS